MIRMGKWEALFFLWMCAVIGCGFAWMILAVIG
jgi:hypothetical protein